MDTQLRNGEPLCGHVDVPVSPPPPCLPTALPSHASAPGVPGGSASAQAVAPLPGAVDEAQGVFKLLPDGSLVDCFVREVYLCWDKQGALWVQAVFPGDMKDLQGPAHSSGDSLHVSSFPLVLQTDSPRPSLLVYLEFTGPGYLSLAGLYLWLKLELPKRPRVKQ